jgi:large subunit ribosomal protein L16
MLQPKKTKFRKMQKGRNKGIATSGNKVEFGSIGMRALNNSRITARQIESARKAINRYIKREGKLLIRIFPDKPITKKPIEVRQGKGKGSVEYWVALVKKGKILFELDGIEKTIAKEAFRLGSAKLPIKTDVIERVIK